MLNLANNTYVIYGAFNTHATATIIIHTLSLHNALPILISINRGTPAASPTNADSVTYLVTFSEPVTGLTASNFTSIDTSEDIGALTSSNGGKTWSVTLSGGDLASLYG